MTRAVIDLKEIVQSLDCVSPDVKAYLDTTTGEAIMVTSHEIEAAEDGDSPDDDAADWELESLAQVKSILENANNRYLELPDSLEIHEWKIMAEFADSFKDGKIANELQRAVTGKKAFRTFKDCVLRHKIEEQWYKHKNGVLREIAIEWCKDNDVSYQESDQQ